MDMLVKLKGLQIKSVVKTFIIFINVLIVFYITGFYLFNNDEPSPIIKEQLLTDDEFMCHYIKDKDALPAIDQTIDFPEKSIFFIESTCKGLTSRQACSVESAARANPNIQVNVLFTSPVTWDKFKGSAISTLLSIENVEAARIHLETFAENTPLYDKFRMLRLTKDDLNMELADVLKFLTIYKYNGIYLGLDVIVARSLEGLKANWVVKETPASISSNMFSFSRNTNGKALADIALNFVVSDLAKRESHALWSFDSSTVMTKLMHIWCLSKDIMLLNDKMCPDLQILEPENFYPISIYDREKYFQPEDWAKWKERKMYTYQFWDRLTKYIVLDKRSLYANLAREYCPTIYNFYGDKFGML